MSWKVTIGALLAIGVLLVGACESPTASISSSSGQAWGLAKSDSSWEGSTMHCPHFPGIPFDSIMAFKFSSSPTLLPNNRLPDAAKRLLPSQEADVRVAVNLAARHPFLAGLDCHDPDWAIAYMFEGQIVADLTLSSSCGTVRFRPCAPHHMHIRGYLRLMQVISELNLD